MMTRKEFIELFLSKTNKTVFPELHVSWVSRNTSTPEKAKRFERFLNLPVTLEWLRAYGREIYSGASRTLIQREDPEYAYDPEVTGQRARILSQLGGLLTNTVNQARGSLDVETVRVSSLPAARFKDRIIERDYEPSNNLIPLTLCDRSDTAIDDPKNTALIIGVNAIPSTSDVLMDRLFKLNYRVLARVAAFDPVDPVALQNTIEKYQAKLLVLRYTGGPASPMHQVRAVIKRLPQYKIAKRIIAGEPLITFRLHEESAQ
ncbi:MAG: hypothetical protein RJB39_182 [Candidatus Parcubacteria bacterium]|jgi:hypothetical protein